MAGQSIPLEGLPSPGFRSKGASWRSGLGRDVTWSVVSLVGCGSLTRGSSLFERYRFKDCPGGLEKFRQPEPPSLAVVLNSPTTGEVMMAGVLMSSHIYIAIGGVA